MTKIVQQTERICIVGAGLVGTLLSIRLARAGFAVDLYEKRKDPRYDTFTRGRSVAMSLSTRGWHALREAGMEDAIRAFTNPTHSRMVHIEDDGVYTQQYGKPGQAYNTINRSFLQNELINTALKEENIRLFFLHECHDLDPDTAVITFKDLQSDTLLTRHYARIIGADGIFSKVREILSSKKSVDFVSTTLDHGYKELCIPAKDGRHALPDGHVHVWPRANTLLIALPTVEKDFMCTLFLPLTGPQSFESITTQGDVQSFFQNNFPDLAPLMPDITEAFFRNPTSHITQVIGGHWNYGDKVLLVGDACHAITLFYAMGMNIGFEDCTIFMRVLTDNQYDLGKSFQMFEALRKPDTDAMTEMSLNNYRSIGESTDRSYHLKWQLERRIGELCPEGWMPAYTLIVFTHVPLATVQKIKATQEGIIESILKSHTDPAALPDEVLKRVVEEHLSRSSVTYTQHVSDTPHDIFDPIHSEMPTQNFV